MYGAGDNVAISWDLVSGDVGLVLYSVSYKRCHGTSQYRRDQVDRIIAVSSDRVLAVVHPAAHALWNLKYLMPLATIPTFPRL